jgi:hypothetical protein
MFNRTTSNKATFAKFHLLTFATIKSTAPLISDNSLRQALFDEKHSANFKSSSPLLYFYLYHYTGIILSVTLNKFQYLKMKSLS